MSSAIVGRKAPGSSRQGLSGKFAKIDLKKPLFPVSWGLKKPHLDKGRHVGNLIFRLRLRRGAGAGDGQRPTGSSVFNVTFVISVNIGTGQVKEIQRAAGRSGGGNKAEGWWVNRTAKDESASPSLAKLGSEASRSRDSQPRRSTSRTRDGDEGPAGAIFFSDVATCAVERTQGGPCQKSQKGEKRQVSFLVQVHLLGKAGKAKKCSMQPRNYARAIPRGGGLLIFVMNEMIFGLEEITAKVEARCSFSAWASRSPDSSPIGEDSRYLRPVRAIRVYFPSRVVTETDQARRWARNRRGSNNCRRDHTVLAVQSAQDGIDELDGQGCYTGAALVGTWSTEFSTKKPETGCARTALGVAWEPCRGLKLGEPAEWHSSVDGEQALPWTFAIDPGRGRRRARGGHVTDKIERLENEVEIGRRGFAVCWETWGTLDLFDQLMIFGPAVVSYGHFDVTLAKIATLVLPPAIEAAILCANLASRSGKPTAQTISRKYQIYSGRRPMPFPATKRRIYSKYLPHESRIYPHSVRLQSLTREYTQTLSTLLKSVVREYTCTLYPNLPQLCKASTRRDRRVGIIPAEYTRSYSSCSRTTVFGVPRPLCLDMLV
ncbi:hypothetical protein B0H16DRAFT_1458692 [Mycena metata]|uniref:Uncharacterized protein n=1 Tax=Mycena metata TaxID=1033252 RepID=A0AAD7J2Y3_9AGAR|nr:hypothetical protein B0H16DRAFT_1458692 [Mycena metata]